MTYRHAAGDQAKARESEKCNASPNPAGRVSGGLEGPGWRVQT